MGESHWMSLVTAAPAVILPLSSLHNPLPTGHQTWDEVLHSQHPHSTKVLICPNFHPPIPNTSSPKSPHQHKHFSLLFSSLAQRKPGPG